MRYAAAAVAAAAVLLAGCTSDADEPNPSPSPRPSRVPPAGDVDEGYSAPVEDRVYPDVGDPGVDALHYDLTLDLGPGHAEPRRAREADVPRDHRRRRVPARPRRAPHRGRGDDRRRRHRLRARRQGPRRRPPGRRRRRVHRVRPLLRHAAAGPRAGPPPRLLQHRLDDHPRRRRVDDAGAVRRVHLVRRQRPAVRQGALRHHRPRPAADGRCRQRRAALAADRRRPVGQPLAARRAGGVVPRHGRDRRLRGDRGRVGVRGADQLLDAARARRPDPAARRGAGRDGLAGGAARPVPLRPPGVRDRRRASAAWRPRP